MGKGKGAGGSTGNRSDAVAGALADGPEVPTKPGKVRRPVKRRATPKPKGKRARHEAVLDAALKRALTHTEVLQLRKAIIASKGDESLSSQVVDLLRESSVLLALAHAAGRSFALDDLLPAVSRELTAAFDADRAVVFLHDPVSRTLFARVDDGRRRHEIRVPDTTGIASWVVANGEPILVPDAYADKRFNQAVDENSVLKTRDLIAAPLRTPLGTVIGVGELLNTDAKRRFDQRDLHLFALAMAQLAVPLQNAWLLEEIQMQRAAQKKAEGELNAGRAIQMGLLPHLPERPDLEVAAHGEPAKPLGGDLYDLVLLDDSTLFFLIGDVAGKGVPAALFMAVAHTLFRTHVRRPGLSLAEVVTRTNAELWEENPEALFVTAFCGILDLRTGELEYAICGHERPFLLRRTGEPAVERLPGRINPAICFDPDVSYVCDSTRLQPGDMLVLYTDGVTEAHDPAGGQFGTDRLAATLAALPGDVPTSEAVDAVRCAVDSFRAGRARFDDMTLLALRWRGA